MGIYPACSATQSDPAHPAISIQCLVTPIHGDTDPPTLNANCRL